MLHACLSEAAGDPSCLATDQGGGSPRIKAVGGWAVEHFANEPCYQASHWYASLTQKRPSRVAWASHQCKAELTCKGAARCSMAERCSNPATDAH